MTSIQHNLEGLSRRYQLLCELDSIIDESVPKDIEKKLNDPSVFQDTDFVFILSSLKTSLDRFQSVRDDIYRRITEASWDCVTELYGIKKGDIIHETYHSGETSRFFAECANPEFYGDWRPDDEEPFAHFTISGPNVLSDGTSGKRRSSLDTRKAHWERITVNGECQN